MNMLTPCSFVNLVKTIVPNISLFPQKKKTKKMIFIMVKLVRPRVKMTVSKTGDIFFIS